MQTNLEIQQPTPEQLTAFKMFIRHDINVRRQQSLLPMLDSEQSTPYLFAALAFINKHGQLKSPAN